MKQHLLNLLAWAGKNPGLALTCIAVAVGILNLLLSHWAKLHGGYRTVLLGLAGRLGFTGAAYKAAFLKSHRELKNIYLDKIEQLDVVATYVPLHVLHTGGGPTNQPAIDVLLDPEQNRLIILGDPGSGKTTLLKSFGVSLVSSTRPWNPLKTSREPCPPPLPRGLKLFPIYVELRDFAARLKEYPTLADYVIKYVLARALPKQDGKGFLRTLLLRGQCVLLLDALDEVGQEDYEAVRLAVHQFLTDEDEDLPTKKARVVLTSRYTNFLAVREDWVPTAFAAYHVLAPFSDDDIQHFLQRRSADLPDGKTPMALWEEIRTSSALDLHRTPLILTVSLGLYRDVPRFTIPDSIAKFYEEISRMLLQRHDFRTRSHLKKHNQFPRELKLQFLREFALHTAEREGRFEEFTQAEMTAAYRELCARSTKLTEGERDAFLDEIIHKAGLIRPVSDRGTFVFAHRSFHEYFAALELSLDAEPGVRKVLHRAADPLWRQITTFFAALEHKQHDLLLQELSERNPELAGYCLAATSSVSPPVAQQVVARLRGAVSQENAVRALGAFSAICRNTTGEVRAECLAAIRQIFTQVLRLDDTLALRTLSRDDLIGLIRDLAATGAQDVAEACVALSRLTDDDPRTVLPLWSCLACFEQSPDAGGAARLVKRLLELAQTEAGFEALQAAPPHPPPFVTTNVRERVYPFERGLKRDSNLVTLLAWSECTKETPLHGIGFMRAFKERSTSEWPRIEKDLARSPIVLRPYWLGLLLFCCGMGFSIVHLWGEYSALGWPGFYHRSFPFPFSPWSGWLFLILVCFTCCFLWLMSTMSNDYLQWEFDSSNTAMLLSINITVHLFSDYSGSNLSAVFLFILSFGIGPIPICLAVWSIFSNIAVFLRVLCVFFGITLFYMLPAHRFFTWQSRWDLRSRSRLANLMLSDEMSLRWLGKDPKTFRPVTPPADPE